MKVIGFDCSTDEALLAASEGEEVLLSHAFPPDDGGRPTHSRSLLAGIDEAAEALGGWGEVDRIAVGLGPGTFTGLRIAIATALGLGLSSGVPVVGVSSLEAMAESLGEFSGVRFPLLDARRGEVFVAAYAGDGSEMLPPAALSPEAAADAILGTDGPVKVGGPGAIRFQALFVEAGISLEDPRSASGRLSGDSICRLGVRSPAPVAGQTPQPIYIREPDAKLWLEREGREFAR